MMYFFLFLDFHDLNKTHSTGFITSESTFINPNQLLHIHYTNYIQLHRQPSSHTSSPELNGTVLSKVTQKPFGLNSNSWWWWWLVYTADRSSCRPRIVPNRLRFHSPDMNGWCGGGLAATPCLLLLPPSRWHVGHRERCWCHSRVVSPIPASRLPFPFILSCSLTSCQMYSIATMYVCYFLLIALICGFKRITEKAQVYRRHAPLSQPFVHVHVFGTVLEIDLALLNVRFE